MDVGTVIGGIAAVCTTLSSLTVQAFASALTVAAHSFGGGGRARGGHGR